MAYGEENRGTLMTATLQLLKERKESLCTIQNKTGLPFYWLRKFASGETPDPSVNRIQKLYEYLAGRPLPLPELKTE